MTTGPETGRRCARAQAGRRVPSGCSRRSAAAPKPRAEAGPEHRLHAEVRDPEPPQHHRRELRRDLADLRHDQQGDGHDEQEGHGSGRDRVPEAGPRHEPSAGEHAGHDRADRHQHQLETQRRAQPDGLGRTDRGRVGRIFEHRHQRDGDEAGERQPGRQRPWRQPADALEQRREDQREQPAEGRAIHRSCRQQSDAALDGAADQLRLGRQSGRAVHRLLERDGARHLRLAEQLGDSDHQAGGDDAQQHASGEQASGHDGAPVSGGESRAGAARHARTRAPHGRRSGRWRPARRRRRRSATPPGPRRRLPRAPACATGPVPERDLRERRCVRFMDDSPREWRVPAMV